MRRVLFYLFITFSFAFISNVAWGQAPNISYSTSSIVFTDGTAITPLSPSNSGGTITGGYSIPANFATVPTPRAVVTDAAGNVYAIDKGDAILYKITAAGTTTKFNTTNFLTPVGMAIDNTAGIMYVSDSSRNTIYPITTATGKYIAGSQIRAGSITMPCGIAVDASGNIYVVNRGNSTVSKIIKGATTSTAILSGFTNPYGIAIDGSGNIFVSEYGNNDIIKIANGTTGGTAKAVFATGFNRPSHLSFDASGNLCVADYGTSTIKKVTTAGVISTFLSTGVKYPLQAAFDSSSPQIVYEADNGTGYINKSFFTQYSISIPLPAGLSFSTTTGTISGTPTVPSPVTSYTITAYNGSGSSSFTISLSVFTPIPSISYTPSTNTYVVGNAIPTLTPVNLGGTVHPITFNNTGTLLTGAKLNQPWGMGIDPSGNIYVTNGGNGTISEYTSAGVWITDSYGGTFTSPSGVVFDSSGNGYVCDQGAGIIYVVSKSTGTTTALITGLYSPWAIAIDGANNLYIAEDSNDDVVKYSTSGGSPLLTIAGGNGNGPVLYSPVGVAVDPSGNIYILDFLKKQVTKYNSIGTYQTTIVSGGFSYPLSLAVDPAGNIYVGDQSANGNASLTGFVNVYNQSGVKYTSITGVNDPEGIAIDVSGNLYLSAQTNNTVYKYTPGQGYFISPDVPPGLSFNGNNGQFTGTPTTSFPPTNYTVTAYNSSGSGSTVVNLSCYRDLSWVGSSASTNWGLSTNWSPAYVPTSADTVRIGATASFTNGFPVVNSAAAAASVILGTQGGLAAGITVNSGNTLTVSGAITYQSDAKSNLGFTANLSGGGTITANNINVIANTTLAGLPYTEALSSSIANLNVNQNIALTSTKAGADKFNASFSITGGTVAINGNIQTTNASGTTSSFTVIPTTAATLKLGGAAALSDLSTSGTNVINFNSPGATIEYSGASQTVYTDASISGLPGGVSYVNIKFSGTGVKAVSTGNLNIGGDFTNALTNDGGDYVNLSTPVVNFSGTTQNLAGGSGNGTTFYNVNFSGLGTKTINSGNFYIASSGILTMVGSSSSTVLAAGGLLTLNSDATGSATITSFTGPQITGNVNVQRFLTGGNTYYRGYRLLTSTVNNGSGIFSINYIKNSCYLTGTTGAAGGFDNPSGGNPTLYLFRENLAPSNSSFTSGNFRGINNINTPPSYSIDNDGSGFTIPTGNGLLFFFRGDRSTSFSSKTTPPYPVPENTTLTETGTLNQGPITVNDWYTPASPNLGFTNTAGNSTVQGFNLVGNPYPSSINWDTYTNAVTTTGISAPNVSSYIYVLDSKSKNYNVYSAGFGGAGTLAAANSNIIPSGQGFFVVATGANASLTFNESAKINTQASNTNGNLFLGPPPPAVVKQYLRLQLSQDSVITDGTFVSFNSTSSPKYVQKEDAPYKPGNGPVSLSSISADGISLAINSQALPKLQPSVINLAVNTNSDGLYHLDLTDIKSIPQLYDIWLMDAYNKDSLDMKHNPGYSFNVYKNDAASYGSQRFTLVIRENPALMIHLLNFTATKTQQGSQVAWETENEQNYSNFTVERSTDNGATFGVLGGVASAGLGTYSFLDKNPAIAADQYRLKIEDLNGTISYSPVVTLMYSNLSNTKFVNYVNVYPNPAVATINLSIIQNSVTASGVFNVPTPGYDIVITNSMGAVIKKATSMETSWNDDVSNLLPGIYFVQVVNANDKSIVGKTKFVKL